MVSARMDAEPPETKTVRQMGGVMVRLKPLGMDRDRRRYWLLAKGEVREVKNAILHNRGDKFAHAGCCLKLTNAIFEV